MNHTPPRRGPITAGRAAGLAGLALFAGLLAASYASLQNPPPAGAALPAGATGTLVMYFPYVPKGGPTPTMTPLPVTPPASGDWQVFIDYYRQSAHLPPLNKNGDWSQGAFLHARYMVENDVATASEVMSNPWYTLEGAAAAPNLMYLLHGDAGLTDQDVLDIFMAWPFHALSILDPQLHTTGFGRYAETGPDIFGPFLLGGALDVRRGLAASVPGGTLYPIYWPGHNATVYLTRYANGEAPNPLASCPGYDVPLGAAVVGLPIVVQLGPGDVTPNVTDHGLWRGGTPLAHCVFDELTYSSGNTDEQAIGRALLAARDAVVIIPRNPLQAGVHTITLTVNGQFYRWTFNVAP